MVIMMPPLSRKDSIRIAVAAIYLFSLLFFALCCGMNLFFSFKTDVTATRLRIVVDNPLVNVGEEIRITMMAIDDDGYLDSSRNDLVEISTNTESKARLSQSRVYLENGKAYVILVDDNEESVVITVRWISGGHSLQGDYSLIGVLKRAT